MQSRQGDPHIEQEDEIDIKDIFSTILTYKKSIFIITTTLTLFAFIYAYFSPNIYRSNALVKITSGNSNSYQGDLASIAMGKSENNIDDEIVEFTTSNIANKALKDLNIGIRYYTNKAFKKHELYKDSPFVVTTSFTTAEATSTYFQVTPIDEKTFRLSISVPLKTKIRNTIRSFLPASFQKKQPFSYSKIHHFSEEITTPWFSINIQKVYEFKEKNYFFSLTDNNLMGGFIQGKLSASLHTKFGSIIALQFTDTVPLRAKEILDAVTHAYMKENLALKAESVKKKLYFVDMQLKAINKTLKGSADKLQSYKATNIMMSLNTKVQNASTKLSDLENQLYQINLRTDVIENILTYINKHQDIKGIDVDSALEASPVVGNVLIKMQKDRILLSNLLTDYTRDHPKVLKVTRRLNFIKGTLKETITNSLNALLTHKLSLKKSIDKHKNLLQALPVQEQELEQLSRNFMVNEKIYSFLLQKRAEIAIAESSIVSDTRIVEEASVSWSPVKPKRSMIIFVGFVLGLILGTSLAFLRAFLDNTVKTVEEIEKYTNIPIYASIPSIKSIQHYTEAMRVLWTNLEFSHIKGDSKLITVSSSVAGEGKTLTISELGNLIAKSHKSVIILDLDMRKSKLHTLYQCPNTIGMSNLLAQRNSLEECVQHTEHEKLHIISSGPKPPNPTSLIMSDELEHIIDTLLTQYDYVLMDSPPIGLVSDAMKLMHLSDISLILLRANVSKKEFISNIARLTKDPNINAGIILNDIKLDNDYGYGYGYGYGY